jgi:hypothetical protein
MGSIVVTINLKVNVLVFKRMISWSYFQITKFTRYAKPRLFCMVPKLQFNTYIFLGYHLKMPINKNEHTVTMVDELNI